MARSKSVVPLIRAQTIRHALDGVVFPREAGFPLYERSKCTCDTERCEYCADRLVGLREHWSKQPGANGELFNGQPQDERGW